MIGQALNKRYRVTALLGEGAMGEVYRATDLHAHREVAVKVFTQKLATNSTMLERFRHEGEALYHRSPTKSSASAARAHRDRGSAYA